MRPPSILLHDVCQFWGNAQHGFYTLEFDPDIVPTVRFKPCFLEGFFGGKTRCQTGYGVLFGKAILEFGCCISALQKTLTRTRGKDFFDTVQFDDVYANSYNHGSILTDKRLRRLFYAFL